MIKYEHKFYRKGINGGEYENAVSGGEK